VDVALLEAAAVKIEGVLDGKHEGEDEEPQKHSLMELRSPNAYEYAGDHYKRPDAGERSKEKHAGGAADVRGWNHAKGDIGQHERSVGKEDQEHAPSGLFEVRTERLWVP